MTKLQDYEDRIKALAALQDPNPYGWPPEDEGNINIPADSAGELVRIAGEIGRIAWSPTHRRWAKETREFALSESRRIAAEHGLIATHESTIRPPTLAERLQRTLDNRGCSISEAAELSGMAVMHVHRIVTGKTPNPGILTVQRIVEGIGATMAELFEDKEQG